jgi:hypothetical protein
MSRFWECNTFTYLKFFNISGLVSKPWHPLLPQ